MKSIAVFVAACAALVALAGDPLPAQGLTTNLVVYADVHVPTNTSHYHATRLNLTIRNGLIVECCSEGVFDLFNGLAAEQSAKARVERRKKDVERRKTVDKIHAKIKTVLPGYVSVATNGTGTARFDFKGNDGRFTIRADGMIFPIVTKWSPCNADTVYAYKDYVDLVGWKDGQTDFPRDVSEFVGWDWTRRVVDAKKGCVIAFMGKGGNICAVRIVNVSDRDRGAAKDELQIEYRIY